MIEPIVTFLKKHLHDKPAVIGLSGGVDSTVVAYLLTKAISTNKIYSFYLPSGSNTQQDLDDAKLVISKLKITNRVINIDPIIHEFQKIEPSISALSLGNLKARVRMSVLYMQANELGGLVVGTGNRTEFELGYFTKYGDGGVDLAPLAHLYKTQVWELAKQLGVPEQIISKAPSAGLWSGQTDETELGMTYQMADSVLKDKDYSNLTVVEKIKQLQKSAQHKLVLPPHL
ncbi:MAG: NAD+ synthase [Patescibacteria group bacterium]|jgi:NAD+ synthase